MWVGNVFLSYTCVYFFRSHACPDRVYGPRVPPHAAVVCGGLKGIFHCKAMRVRVVATGEDVSLAEFERLAGRGSRAPRWRSSIRVVKRDGTLGETLGDWMEDVGLQEREERERRRLLSAAYRHNGAGGAQGAGTLRRAVGRSFHHRMDCSCHICRGRRSKQGGQEAVYKPVPAGYTDPRALGAQGGSDSEAEAERGPWIRSGKRSFLRATGQHIGGAHCHPMASVPRSRCLTGKELEDLGYVEPREEEEEEEGAPAPAVVIEVRDAGHSEPGVGPEGAAVPPAPLDAPSEPVPAPVPEPAPVPAPTPASLPGVGSALPEQLLRQPLPSAPPPASLLPHELAGSADLTQVPSAPSPTEDALASAARGPVVDERVAAALAARRANAMSITERWALMQRLENRRVTFGKSGIHGWGLMAREFIPADTMLIDYRGDVIRKPLADKREAQYKASHKDCYLFTSSDEFVVDATDVGSIARFCNHSCSPSLYTKIFEVNGASRLVFITKADVPAGQELTYDYRFEREEGLNRIPCQCGAPTCKRYIN